MASMYQNIPPPGSRPPHPNPQGSFPPLPTPPPPPPPPPSQPQYGAPPPHPHNYGGAPSSYTGSGAGSGTGFGIGMPPPPASAGAPLPYNPNRPNNAYGSSAPPHMMQYGLPPLPQQHQHQHQHQPQHQHQQHHGFPPPGTSSSSSYPLPPPLPLLHPIPLPPQNSQPLPPPPPPPPPHHNQHQHPPYLPTSHFPQYTHQSQPPPSHERPASPPPPPPPPPSPPPPPFPPSQPQPQSQPQSQPHPQLVKEKENEKQTFSTPKPLPKSKDKVESEEERRMRKKREHEQRKQQQQQDKQRREKELRKNQLQLGSSAKVTQLPVSASRGGGGDRKLQYLPTAADKIDNKLKKPTTFLCKLKFRNELPDPTTQPKLLSFNTNKDQYTKYTITSLEKMHKPKLFVEPDLGIPLDLLDISVYNPPKVKQPMAVEDEELLRDDEMTTPNRQDGIRRKERPTDKGVGWLVKTQYISPISLDSTTKQTLTLKQAKELRETREGRDIFLETLNNRDQQIQAIEESFRVSKLRPVHQAKPFLEPVEILPLLPDFDRWEEQLILATFDGEATADSEIYSKLEPSVRDEIESRAVMKSFVQSGTNTTKKDTFLAYMVPGVEELMKDMYDEEEEEMSYSWLREYHWEVRPDDANNAATYVITFGEDATTYLPLQSRLALQKRRAKEGRYSDDIENPYPVPSRVTVRNRIRTHKDEELRNSGRSRLMEGHGSIAGSKRRSPDEDIHRSRHKVGRIENIDHNLSPEEDMSE